MQHEKLTASELESRADLIMQNFDFEKVQQHMQSTDWRWVSDGGMQVPDLDTIKSTARSLLTQAIWSEEPVSSCATGGFCAYKLPWGLSLTFQIGWSHA